MTPTNQLPKLSSLSPEQRRVLCAEELGWKLVLKDCWKKDNDYAGVCGRSDYAQLPSPDSDANDALSLVEHLGKDGWDFCAQRYPHQAFIVTFWRDVKTPREKHQGKEPTFPRALTSAFLLATGKAKM